MGVTAMITRSSGTPPAPTPRFVAKGSGKTKTGECGGGLSVETWYMMYMYMPVPCGYRHAFLGAWSLELGVSSLDHCCKGPAGDILACIAILRDGISEGEMNRYYSKQAGTKIQFSDI